MGLAPLTVPITADTAGFTAGVARAERDAIRFTQSMQKQAATVGKTKDEARLYALQLKGASDETIKAAKAAISLRDAEAAKAQQMARGKHIAESLLTPTERYNQELRELRQLLKDNAISQETFTRAQKRSYDQTVLNAKVLPDLSAKQNAIFAQQSQSRMGAFKGQVVGGLGGSLGNAAMMGGAAAASGMAVVMAVQKSTQAYKAAARAAVDMTVDAVKVSEEFNTALNNSLAILPNVGNALRKEMGDAAIQAARSSKFAANEAAQAFFFLESAGLDAKQSIAALPQVTKFAQAGNFDLARATDLATDAQSALGLTVKDAGKNLQNLTRVTDVLISANTKANATAEQFSQALTAGAAVAGRQAGKEIEEITAVLAVFADQGVKAEEAGTQFGIVMRDLQTKAITNKNAFKENNIAVFDDIGNMRNMADIVADLENRLGGMSTEMQKTTLMQLGFSDKSVKATQTLLGFSSRIRELETGLSNAGGTVEQVANRQLTEFQKGIQASQAEVTRLKVELGTPIADAFGKSLQDIADRLAEVQISDAGLEKFSERLDLTASAFTGATEAGIGYLEMLAELADKSIANGGITKGIIGMIAGNAAGGDGASLNVGSNIREDFLRREQDLKDARNLTSMLGGSLPRGAGKTRENGSVMDASTVMGLRMEYAQLTESIKQIGIAGREAFNRGEDISEYQKKLDNLGLAALKRKQELEKGGFSLTEQKPFAPEAQTSDAASGIFGALSGRTFGLGSLARSLRASVAGTANGMEGGLLGKLREGLTYTSTTGGLRPTTGTVAGIGAGSLEALRIEQAARAGSGSKGPQEKQVDLLQEVVDASRQMAEGIKVLNQGIQQARGFASGVSLLIGGSD